MTIAEYVRSAGVEGQPDYIFENRPMTEMWPLTADVGRFSRGAPHAGYHWVPLLFHHTALRLQE